MSASPRALGLMLAVLAGTAGCASIKSTFLERDPSDTAWTQSTDALNGVPVTLAVPTHVKVQFVKTYHYFVDTDATKPAVQLMNGKEPLVTYDFNYEVIQEKKVVMVDFKRPASGSFEMTATINKDTGYFTQITHKGEDTTIATVGTQVNSVLGTILKGGRTAVGDNSIAKDAKINSLDTVVATVFLKVNDPDFENQLREFVCCSLKTAGLPQCGCEVGFHDGGHCTTPDAHGVTASLPTKSDSSLPGAKGLPSLSK